MAKKKKLSRHLNCGAYLLKLWNSVFDSEQSSGPEKVTIFFLVVFLRVGTLSFDLQNIFSNCRSEGLNLNVIYSSTIDKIHFRIMTVAFLLILLMCSEKHGALPIQGEPISTSFTEINHRYYTAKYTPRKYKSMSK